MGLREVTLVTECLIRGDRCQVSRDLLDFYSCGDDLPISFLQLSKVYPIIPDANVQPSVISMAQNRQLLFRPITSMTP